MLMATYHHTRLGPKGISSAYGNIPPYQAWSQRDQQCLWQHTTVLSMGLKGSAVLMATYHRTKPGAKGISSVSTTQNVPPVPHTTVPSLGPKGSAVFMATYHRTKPGAKGISSAHGHIPPYQAWAQRDQQCSWPHTTVPSLGPKRSAVLMATYHRTKPGPKEISSAHGHIPPYQAWAQRDQQCSWPHTTVPSLGPKRSAVLMATYHRTKPGPKGISSSEHKTKTVMSGYYHNTKCSTCVGVNAIVGFHDDEPWSVCV